MAIATVTIQRCPANSPKDVFIPNPKKDPHLDTLFLELNAAIPLWFWPIDATKQNPKVNTFENDGLHTQQLNAHTLRKRYETNANTNQDLVVWPRYIHVHWDSRQIKMRPKLVYQFITST